MKTQPGQLPKLLEKGLASVYLVSGDEPLLVQECCDLVRAAAKQSGYQDRISYHADHQMEWNALSLFAEKRRIEIHLPAGKLGDGRKVLEQILQSPPDDVLLLLISTRLDAAETRRKWYKDLQGKGVHIPVWPIESDKFPGWLQQRANNQGLTLTRGALNMLGERLEGNLLAASQELDRLALLAPDQTIDEETIERAVQASARFSGFELVTELLAGKSAHACKIIGVLQQEGENPLGLLSVLVRDIHISIELKSNLPPGEHASGFLKKRGVFQPRRASAIQQAARRLSLPMFYRALELCSITDRSAKGFDKLQPWHHLRDLAALLGTRPPG